MAHGEAAHGDVVAARLVGIEHRAAHVDLDQLLVRIDALELRPDRGVRRVHLGEPQLGVQRGRSVRALEHQAERLDAADRLDLGLERRPRLPVAGVGDRTRAQQFAVRRVQSDLDESAVGGRGRANLDLLGARAEVHLLVAHPVAVLDEADALAAFRARGVLSALLRGETCRGNSPGTLRAVAGPQPGHVQQVLPARLAPARPGTVPAGISTSSQLGRLDQPVAVEIDGAGVMLAPLGIEPVAVNQVAVGIEVRRRRSWAASPSRRRPGPSPSP